MTSGNAFGFLLFSVLMVAAPTLAPGWFPPSGFDGTNGRAIWLLVMGGVQAGVGSFYLVSRSILPVVLRVAAFRPSLPQLQPQGQNLPQGSVV